MLTLASEVLLHIQAPPRSLGMRLIASSRNVANKVSWTKQVLNRPNFMKTYLIPSLDNSHTDATEMT